MIERAEATTRHWLLWLFALVLALVGLAMTAGGGWLIWLGGSWYYLLAGLGMLLAGIQLMRGRVSGARWYAAVFIGTLGWAIYEAGLDYWRWIPRFGLVVVFAFILALLLPKLEGGPSRAVSRSLAVLLALVFIAVFALAFLPHGVTRADRGGTRDAAAAERYPIEDAGFEQPADAPADGDWSAYARSNAAMRYSPLARVRRDNVANLTPAWTYRTGDLPEERWGAETTPIKVGDSLYLCSARSVVISLDAATGEERWRYDPEVSEQSIPYTAACRGVTYYEVPPRPAASPPPQAAGEGEPATPTDTLQPAPDCPTRIFSGTLDGRLIAVDAETGQPCESFGSDGEIDITEGMGQTLPGMVSVTSPPVVVRGVLVTGHQVLDGQRRDAPSGVIQAFDAVTGELRWAWDMGRANATGPPPRGRDVHTGHAEHVDDRVQRPGARPRVPADGQFGRRLLEQLARPPGERVRDVAGRARRDYR